MIARIKLWLALRKRKSIRIAEGNRVKAGQLVAQRKAWKLDPLRRA